MLGPHQVLVSQLKLPLPDLEGSLEVRHSILILPINKRSPEDSDLSKATEELQEKSEWGQG